MVRLSKIYTKTGDDGTTGLGDGSRSPKNSVRVEAYGTVDEANAAVGVAVVVADEHGGDGEAKGIGEVLRSIQHDLFDVGADLCTPISPSEKPGEALRVTAQQSARLERLIDRYNEPLPALKSFVLPGGSELSAALHVARTVTRRAERLVVALRELEPAATSAEAVIYLNRLSDLLFVLGRVANRRADGTSIDVLWVPGRNRERPE